jgi:hypothetical protein
VNNEEGRKNYTTTEERTEKSQKQGQKRNILTEYVTRMWDLREHAIII